MASFLEEEPAVDHWGLKVPCVTYEEWCDDEAYEEAQDAWLSLSDDDLKLLRDNGLLPQHTLAVGDVGWAGYAGSTIIHVPQIRPFLPNLYTLVLPDGPKRWGRLTIVSMTLDGTVELGVASCELILEPVRDLNSEERLRFLEVYCPVARFADMSAATEAGKPQFLAKFPEERFLGPGTDAELMIIPEKGPPCRMSWGLIKSVDISLRIHVQSKTKPHISKHLICISKEPWIERVPQFGHSLPVDIYHIPPRNPRKIQQAFDLLSKAGSTILLCDPYVSRKTLEKVLRDGKRCKLLTTQASFDKLGMDWCRRNQVEVRIIMDGEGGVHDRFLLGTEFAYILGTSLTGIGNRHSFVIRADNKMKWVLREVFEQLWDSAPLPQLAKPTMKGS
jgi:hypothetical protein